MVPHFRNSVPRELLHNSIPTSFDGSYSPQTSFSSFNHEQMLSDSSPRNYDSSGNASRASSIRDLLNPANPSESDCSTSFDSKVADHANAQSSQSTVESVDSSGTDLSQGSNDCQARSTPQSPGLDATSRGRSAEQLTEMGSGIVLGEQRSSSATPSSSENSKAATAVRVYSPHMKCLDPLIASKKRSFDEVEELPRPAPPNSRIRLSMTLDGAVKVRTGDEDTPSPPKHQPQNVAILRKDGLRRTHSAASASEFLQGGQQSKTRPSGGIFGRSRDARTWEFYCDGDARAALSAQAENEHNGSAVGAINLIRSRIQNSKCKAMQTGRPAALKPKMGAGNFQNYASSAEPKSQKPKLVRAMSSMARLSGACKASTAPKVKASTKSHTRRPSGDSDKENWAPGTRCSNHSLRRTQPSSTASQGVLQDEHASANPMSSRMKHVRGNYQHNPSENENPICEDDSKEMGSFRHVEDKEEDLDCIQGLLSLSQGAWR